MTAGERVFAWFSLVCVVNAHDLLLVMSSVFLSSSLLDPFCLFSGTPGELQKSGWMSIRISTTLPSPQQETSHTESKHRGKRPSLKRELAGEPH